MLSSGKIDTEMKSRILYQHFKKKYEGNVKNFKERK